MSPASVRPSPFTSTGVPARLSRVSEVAVEVAVVAVVTGEVARTPARVVPEAVAELVTLPRSTSAWVRVCDPVQVALAPAPGS